MKFRHLKKNVNKAFSRKYKKLKANTKTKNLKYVR